MFLSPSSRLSAAAVSVGGSEEDQRVVLGLGGHEPLHQQQPALAAWWAQRLRFLRLPGGTSGVWPSGQSVHCHRTRPHLWKSYRWEMHECQKYKHFFFKYHGVIWKKKWSPCAGNPSQSSRPSCKKPCSLHTNCANCTSQAMECMWCGSAQRCVDSTAYVISFPYGQCLEWQTGECVGKCLLPSPALDRWCSPALRWSAVSSRRLVSASGQYSSLQEKR